MALMFVISGVLTPLVPLIGMSFRAVRHVEDILPDHDAVALAQAS